VLTTGLTLYVGEQVLSELLIHWHLQTQPGRLLARRQEIIVTFGGMTIVYVQPSSISTTPKLIAAEQLYARIMFGSCKSPKAQFGCIQWYQFGLSFLQCDFVRGTEAKSPAETCSPPSLVRLVRSKPILKLSAPSASLNLHPSWVWY
jgi:hypothetical protein